MKFWGEIILTALRDLSANKLRSLLTMLGIIIGIGSVILVMAIGRGAQQLIVSQVTKIGTNLIGVLPGKSEEKAPPVAAMGITITTLKEDDVQAIKKIPHILAATGYSAGRFLVRFGSQAELFDCVGVDADYPYVENVSLKRGSFFTEDQVRRFAKVAVLGAQAEKNLFKKGEAIGEKIRIGNSSFQVIGVLKKRGGFITGNLDNQILIPLSTAQKYLLGINHLSFIRAKFDDPQNESFVREKMEEVLRAQHHIKDPAKDDFTVRSMSQILGILGNITGAIQAFLVLVVAISLIVGGVGIMNIMLVSLSERIREIGLRKALGATDRSILVQFLAESVLLSLFGGLVGIVSGVGLGIIIAFLIRTFSELEWHFIISAGQIFLAAGVAILIGVLFGLYPARKAAKLDAIEALRYE